MPCAGEHRRQSFFIVFGRHGDRDGIQVDLMFLVQSGPSAANCGWIAPHIRRDTQEIHIARSAGDSVNPGRDEAATAMQLNVFAEAGIHFSEKRSPRLWRLLNCLHRAVGQL